MGKPPICYSSQNTMQSFPSSSINSSILPCQTSNLFYQHNMCSTAISTIFAPNSGAICTAPLPQFTPKPVQFTNTVDLSGGNLDLSINGQAATVLENISTGDINTPEDLRSGIITGSKRASPKNSLSLPTDGIPFEKVEGRNDFSQFLPAGVTEGNTDIDMICVYRVPENKNTPSEGAYNVDDSNLSILKWLFISIGMNSISNIGNEAVSTGYYLNGIRVNEGLRTMKSALKEVIFEGKFRIKIIPSWGGAPALIFKGAHKSRSFLTAAIYGINNGKVSYINNYAKVGSAIASGNTSGALSQTVRTAAKGNLIGFLIASTFDVNDFIKSEDPEKNWGDILGALGVTFIKVWIAGYVGILAAGAVAASVVGAPVLLVVAVGVGVAIAAGVLLDAIDDMVGFKEAAKNMGRALANGTEAAVTAVFTFVEKAITHARIITSSWIDRAANKMKQNLRKNDPTGYCALFCSNPLDQAGAWMRGFGMR